ncbi:sensor histidine kinase [Paenibacillus antri]|nr:histidine kinase [Paenibacillus antri]
MRNIFAFRFPSRYFKNALLLKLVLVYSTIMLVPLLLTIYIITNHVDEQMVEIEIDRQDDLTTKMSEYVDEQYSKIRDIVFWFYNSGANTQPVVDMLVESGKNDSAFQPHIIKNRITSELNKVVMWDKEILDIVLINSNKDVFSTSKRSVSLGYDFVGNLPLGRLDASDKRMHKYPSGNLDYILEGDVPVISHVGNLYDLTNLLNIRHTGRYIINLSSVEVMNHYRSFAGTSDADLYVMLNDGTVLFSNETDAIGSTYPFLEQVSKLPAHEADLGGETYILNKADLSDYGLSIVVQTPKNAITSSTKMLIRQILSIFVVGVVIVLALTSLFSTNIANRIKRLLSAMRQVEKGNFDARVHYESRDEIGQLAAAFNRMCERLKGHVDMVYLAEIKTKSAELSSLQSKINPHFLLNTIESIRMKAVEEDSQEISHMLYTLGRLFHWKVRSTQYIITVEEELEYISSYLYLMQFRYQDQLEVKMNVDEDLHELGIPILLLQPIIENASQHALFHKDQRSILSIRGYRDQHHIVFDIVDNGIGMDELQVRVLEEKTNHAHGASQIGLSNVQQRIRVLFGEPYGLSIASKKHYWTRVRVTIPAMMKKEMDVLVPDFYR